jgi:hypothetical protein
VKTTTIILFVISTMFIITTLPIHLWSILSHYYPVIPYTAVWTRPTQRGLYLFTFINNAYNFVLYCISGREFRNEMARMFSC